MSIYGESFAGGEGDRFDFLQKSRDDRNLGGVTGLLRGILAELGGVEAGVDAVAGEELGMGAALGDAAAIEDEDLVGFEDGAEAMGDDDTGAV